MSRIVYVLALSLMATFAWAEQGVNPHVHASTCLPKERVSCDYRVCELCHTPTSSASAQSSPEWNPASQHIEAAYPGQESAAKLAFGVDDTLILCAQCHDVERTGHHSGNKGYEALLAKMVTMTNGVNLLEPKAADPCELRCTTCHDPHSREVNLLRPNVEASVACLTCHME